MNIAAVAIKTGDYEEALKQCNNILEVDPENPKAHFRRGQAKRGLKDYDLALKDLMRAKELAPGDKSILGEIVKVRELRQKYVDVEKTIYGRMFK